MRPRSNTPLPTTFITEEPVATSEGDAASTEGAPLAAKEGDVVYNDHFAQLRPMKRRPANTTRLVNRQQIGSKRSTAKGMSRKRLANLLEEQMEMDRQMQQATAEAIEQTKFPKGRFLPWVWSG